MSLGTGLEKVWYQKSLGIGSVQIFGYRETLLGRLLLKARTGNSQQLARRLAFLGEIGNFELSFSLKSFQRKFTNFDHFLMASLSVLQCWSCERRLSTHP